MEYKQNLDYITTTILFALIMAIFFVIGIPLIKDNVILWVIFPVLMFFFWLLPLYYIFSKITYIKIDNDSIFISFFKNFKKHDFFIRKDAIRNFRITQNMLIGCSLGKVTKIHVTLDDGKSYNISSDFDEKDIYDFFVNNNANIPHFESKEGLEILPFKLYVIPLILGIIVAIFSVKINNLYMDIMKSKNNTVQEYIERKFHVDHGSNVTTIPLRKEYSKSVKSTPTETTPASEPAVQSAGAE